MRTSSELLRKSTYAGVQFLVLKNLAASILDSTSSENSSQLFFWNIVFGSLLIRLEDNIEFDQDGEVTASQGIGTNFPAKTMAVLFIDQGQVDGGGLIKSFTVVGG
jgi:hypothetical protein